jgi:hypothetical protein
MSMPERKVVAFQNTNNYPVSFNIRGIMGKVMLWEGQQIKDREGIPLVPPETEWSWLISKGVKPVYIEAEVEIKPVSPIEEAPEIILDDIKLMEQKSAAATQNLVAEFLAPKQIVPEEIRAAEESANGGVPPLNYLERPDNPDPAKGALVWQDKDGVWILNKDGFSSINPAEIKKHVRRDRTLGKDFLDILEWRTYGSKPGAGTGTEEDDVKTAEESLKIIEDNFQV